MRGEKAGVSHVADGFVGIECETVDLDGDIDDPVRHVLTVNLHRRHLTTAQRAMVGKRAAAEIERRAKERQKIRKGKQPGASVENLPQLEKGKSRDIAGVSVGVSGKAIDMAAKIINHGTPELVEAVDEGRISVTNAAKPLTSILTACWPAGIKPRPGAFAATAGRRGATVSAVCHAQ